MSTPTPTTECVEVLPVTAEIDLSALQHNVGVVRRSAPGCKVMAVVKSMAYGHGAEAIARGLIGQVDALAVARVGEGVALREAGIVMPIVVLEGPGCRSELLECVAHDLQPALHHESQLALICSASLALELRCWLKLDTGMHRLGFASSRASQLLKLIADLPHVTCMGCMTHLACADDLGDATTRHQLDQFVMALSGEELPASAANSAGVLAWPESHRDWVRPGLMLYGASPLLGRGAVDCGLEPVMTLSAPLLAINHLPAGEPVGYGATWIAPEDMPIGVLGIGYGDGYPRHIGPQGRVLLNGRLVPIVGRVSMDMLTLDLRGVDASVGDRAVLWGRGLPVDDVAAWANTIPYTLLCGVSRRVTRRYRSN